MNKEYKTLIRGHNPRKEEREYEQKLGPLKYDKKRFGHGDSLSEINRVSGPSIPILIDEYKVVFSCCDPKEIEGYRLG